MIAGTSLLSLLVTLVIAGVIFWLIWWFVGYIGVPEPFNKVIRVILGLAVLVFLINILMTLGGHPLIVWR
jgi:hypothetical protein